MLHNGSSAAMRGTNGMSHNTLRVRCSSGSGTRSSVSGSGKLVYHVHLRVLLADIKNKAAACPMWARKMKMHHCMKVYER